MVRRARRLLGAGMLTLACRPDATQLLVEGITDLREGQVASLAVYVAYTQDMTEAVRQNPQVFVQQPKIDPRGSLGSIVVTPGEGDPERVVFVRVALGYGGRDAQTCLASTLDGTGCIVQRRKVRFAEHKHLVMPVQLYAECGGQLCTPQTTCRDGMCVGIDTLCENDLCDLARDQRSVDVVDAALDGTSANDGGTEAGPVALPKVCTQSAATCALLPNGIVKCWGRSHVTGYPNPTAVSYGDKPGTMGPNLPPLWFGSESARVRSLHCGSLGACAVLTTGELRCWGDAVELTQQPGIVHVPAGVDVEWVDLGGAGRICILSTDKRLFCGDVGNLQTRTPVSFGGGSVVSVQGLGMPYESHACALLVGGELRCWGNNEFGQLGLGDTTERAAPLATTRVPFAPGRGVVAFARGGNAYITGAHSLAVLDNGDVKIWGDGSHAILGIEDNNSGVIGDTPGEVANGLVTNFGMRVAEAHLHGSVGCVRSTAGGVKCWGGDGYGTPPGYGDNLARGLAPGTMGPRLPYVSLGASADDATGVASLSYREHACAVLVDGRVKCWGKNFNGELGLGDTTDRGDNPNEMGTNLPAVQLE